MLTSLLISLVIIQAFSGEGQRLDGKINKSIITSTDNSTENKRGLPNYNYKKGKINFIKSKALLTSQQPEPMVSLILLLFSFGPSLKRIAIV